MSHIHNTFYKRKETSWQDIWHNGQCSSCIFFNTGTVSALLFCLGELHFILQKNFPSTHCDTTSVMDKQRIEIIDSRVHMQTYPCIPSGFCMRPMVCVLQNNALKRNSSDLKIIIYGWIHYYIYIITW